ncbi:MAG: FadR family transcriptional regulator [Rhizobiaceae bacterium]|nr:FadR family transcriptional regulator [Rhizobiaceae bacterium]MCV0406011.1 FadR family transcriptional regulator [Rhizobiaceae bacterium]
MPIEAIETRRLYRQVADQLRQLIEAGEYSPGDRLPAERDLAEQFEVSRPTVREAMIALEVEGLVRIRVGSGIYVTSTTGTMVAMPGTPLESPFELLRAREIVEGSIAAEAAAIATSEHIARLDEVLVQARGLPHPGSRTLSLDREFHVRIAGILDNAVLARFTGQLFDQRINPYFERLSSYFEDRDTWKLAMREHQIVRDAIAANDPAAARDAMRRHLTRSRERFERNFGEVPPEGGEEERFRAGASR